MEKITWPSWPIYGTEEEDAVLRVIRSNQIFAADEVKTFEDMFSEYVGVKHSIGLGNATQGLHLALAALDIGIGDEVIVTPYSWISSASCILMQNAIPVFCDIEANTLGLDPSEVEKKITPKTRAIIFVHMFGYPADVDGLRKIADKYGVYLIEDASHAHGLIRDGKKGGAFGDISVFSLHQRKAISVGDGGVVCTNRDDWADKIRRLRSFGHEELSYNYRMTEFAGALGKVGLKKLDDQNLIRKNNAELLAKKITSKTVSVRLVESRDFGVYYAVLLEIIGEKLNVDQKVKQLNDLGIPLKRTWPLLNKHAHFNPPTPPARGIPWLPPLSQEEKKYQYIDMRFPIAEEYCENRIFELNVHPPVSSAELNFAATKINSLFK